MVGAPAPVPAIELSYDGGDRGGDVAGAGRRADLVGDDPQDWALSGEPQHRLDEIAAVRAVDPGGAQDYVVGKSAAHGLIAGLLALTVNPEGLHRIILAIGALLGSVEDVIGREVDQRGQGIMTRGGAARGAAAMSGPAKVVFALLAR